jgi:pyrroline-5-carboxylate reductase
MTALVLSLKDASLFSSCSFMLQQRIGMIGAGRMATALAKGLVANGIVASEKLVASDASKEACQRFAAATGAGVVAENRGVAEQADVIVLAVKPQNLPAIVDDLAGLLGREHLVVSILAGVRLSTLSEGLGPDVRLVRVMPNTPCLVGRGASGFCTGPNSTDDDRHLVQQMFDAVGLAVEVEEPMLDAVTGLSGSGPAFVYLMIEALSDAGVKMGLPHDVSRRLAAQTVHGAAEMVSVTEEHPAALREQVMSPGGTTVAGLQALEDGRFRDVISAAVEAAARRSVELGAK